MIIDFHNHFYPAAYLDALRSGSSRKFMAVLTLRLGIHSFEMPFEGIRLRTRVTSHRRSNEGMISA
jgi:hypothetical protein